MQKNVLEYLELTESLKPDAPAFIDGEITITFRQLRGYGRALGTEIAKLGKRNRPVAVLADPKAYCAAAFMGVLYSGNYYVPIDVKMPAHRLDAILRQLSPAALVYSEKNESAARARRELCPIIPLESAFESAPDEAVLAERRRRTLDIDPAYVLFTSGSTGTPKGIVVSHRSVIDFTDWYTETCGISGGDILGNQAPLFFDLSVKDLYGALKTGAAVHFLPKKFFTFTSLLMQYLAEHKVTVLSWATSAFHLVANSGVLEKPVPQSLRRVILGGEALQAKQLNMWRGALPHAEYINLYGPTETTVDCTYYKINREFADTETVPIGRACENMEILLLDESLCPVPPGTPGEICVRGGGLASGYYGDREKTSASFIQNPLNPYYPETVYRTGDMGFENEDGDIVFLARRDNQVKRMGYRIELGEVEAALNAIDGVRAAVCFFDGEEDKIVSVYEGEPDANTLAGAARGLLPRYMTPDLFRRVDAMPYNANGKTDRVLLKKEYFDGKNQAL